MSPVQVFVIVIGILGGWIARDRFVRLGDQNSSNILHDGYKENIDGLDGNYDYGFACISELQKALINIRHIYVSMSAEQVKIEEMLGELLVTDRLYRLELLHNTSIDEGKHYKSMLNETHALKNGLSLEIWHLAEKFIDGVHLYSAKLLGYSSRMILGLEKAKISGQLKIVTWEVIQSFAFLAGGEKCVITEWSNFIKIMVKYLDWLAYGLKLETKVLNDKKGILNSILERAHLSGNYADKFVNLVGVTNLNSTHDIYFQEKQGEELVNVSVKWVEERKEAKDESKYTQDLIMVFEFTTIYNFNSQKLGVINICKYAIKASLNENEE